MEVTRYGARLFIPGEAADPALIEMACIRSGGKWKNAAGRWCGCGLAYHYKALITALWPNWVWHKWSDLLIEQFAENWLVAVMGPASSGKTACGAVFALADYFTFPEQTTWIVSSTTIPALEARVWGEIKKRLKEARSRRPWLPGHLTDSKHMITTDEIQESDDIRDVRNGIRCVAALQGGTYVGLANYVGQKNARFRQMADELQFMPPAFVDAIANFSKNPDYKVMGFGNPKDRTDALGKLAEPRDEENGWDGVPDNRKTNIWKTRFKDPIRGHGVTVQLDGRDTPNADYPKGLNPFPFLIKPENIEADIAFFGENSPQVSMMDYGQMPTDNQAKRVITRNLCIRGRAFDPVIWEDTKGMLDIACLDAAYSGVGGDRTALIHLKMGIEQGGLQVLSFVGTPVVVPINARSDVEQSVQVARFVRDWCKARGIPPEQLGFDGTGRSSLTSAFGREWSPNVVPIEFGGKASKRSLGKIEDCSKKYRKFVSELWFASRVLIEASQVRAMPLTVFEEGSAREWDIDEGNFEDVESKDDMKLRIGRSPDLYDAFVCGIEMARRLGFRIAIVNAKAEKDGKSWLQRRHERNLEIERRHELEAA